MKKIKALLVLSIIPSIILGACSSNSSSSKEPSLEPSSERSSSGVSASSNKSSEQSSSVVPSSSSSSVIPSSSSSSEPSSSSTKSSEPSSSVIPSSSSSSATSSESSSAESSSSSSGKIDPVIISVPLNLKASLNSMVTAYRLEPIYKDAYFIEDAKEYNKDLSELSFASSYASVDKTTGESFFKTASFNDVSSYSYESAPSKDSIAYIFAHKTYEESDIIAISIRGFEYGMEWANNFLIGEEGDHEGFLSSANKVYSSLKEYIANKCDENKTLKLWISGYSRGGAVSNVLSSLIIRNEEINIELDNMFVYTFEAPTALDLENCSPYENVHNIINKNDLVANVPPRTYQLGRCGVDYEIYDADVTNIAKSFDPGLMIPEIVPIDTGESLDTDEKILQYVLDGVFNNTINPSDENNDWSANTRKDYVANYQASIAYLVGTVFAFKDSTRSQLLDDLSALGMMAVSTLMDAQKFHDFIKKYIEQDNITYDDEELMRACQAVPKATEHLLIKVLLIYGSETYCPDLNRLIDMHYPEVAYALLLNAHKNNDTIITNE